MKNLFLIIFISILLTSCASSGDAFKLKKKSSGDEFLVEKKKFQKMKKLNRKNKIIQLQLKNQFWIKLNNLNVQ